jgi:ADP-heptose:LPS heptosyltransferase
LVAIARAAKLFVSGDTGPLHIAGATGTPIVALFGPTSPARNGPWDHRDVSISRYESCACHCKRVCQREESWCLGQISVDEVRRAIETRVGPS